MDIKQLKDVAVELMAALKANGLGEVELVADDVKIKIKAHLPSPVIASPAPVVGTVSDAALTDKAPAEAPAVKEETVTGTPVKSPVVGTFYSSPAPDAPPFVLVGQEVKEGDVLFIIEAMKTMNEVKAPCDGTIATVLVEPGDMVEYNQTVMVIE